jgi:Outer membrane protein beta-barrel domain
MRTRLMLAIVLGVALVASVLSPAPAAAQGIGFKIGFNYSIFQVTPTTPSDFDTYRGLVGGIAFPGKRDGVVAFQNEILYSIRGLKFKSAPDAFVKLTYIDSPTALKIKVTGSLPVRVHVLVGLNTSFLLKVESNDGGGGTLFVRDDIKIFDFGLLAGADIEVGHLVLDGRYTWGLIEVLNNPVAGEKTTSNALTFMVGVRF